MRIAFFRAPLALLAVTISAQVPTSELNAAYTLAAKELSTLPFDASAPVSVRGRIATLVFPEGAAGLMLVNGPNGEAYAFSTAGVPAMAKQGFSRFTVKPGMEVIVTGVLAPKGLKIGPGFNAARADAVTKLDGSRIFDRSKLEQR